MSGYLQKSSSHSRHKAVKAEATLWQRRFFGLREEARVLEYYGSEESFLRGVKPRGRVPLADCVAEDTDGGGLPRAMLAKSVEIHDGTAVSLLIRIRHRNPRANVYKSSPDLVLRAESAADKLRWLQYLRQVCGDPRPGAMASPGSTKGPGKRDGDPVAELPGAMYDDLPDDDEPIAVSHGLGSAVFWSNICRDETNSLLPSPGLFLDEGSEIKQDLALRQHTRDMQGYTRLVCETLVMTVPKVVVHCLVDKALRRLGPVIEEHILALAPEVREVLVQEAPEVVEYQDRVRQLLHDVSEAEDVVKEVQKSRQAAAREGKGLGDITLSVKVIELAQMINQLRPDGEGLTKRYSLKTKAAVHAPPASIQEQARTANAHRPAGVSPAGVTPARPAPPQPMARQVSAGNLPAQANAARVAPQRRAPGPPPQRAASQNGIANGGPPQPQQKHGRFGLFRGNH
eukprot:evm.model.scf_1480.1 EVM.evm.TU.scf_1480.1   scf_1480:7768-9138(-)